MSKTSSTITSTSSAHSAASVDDPILATALRYIAGGLAVHPCHPVTHPEPLKAGKAPKTTGWQNAKLTAKEFRKAYRKGDNLGVNCGHLSGIVCLDVDAKIFRDEDGKETSGMMWYKAHEDMFGKHIAERTGSGGLHLYYKYPKCLVHPATGESIAEGLLLTCSGKNRFAPGVDFLADGNGQAITAPSLHHSGRRYELINPGLDLLEVEHEADELPEWILRMAIALNDARRFRKEHGQAAAGNDLFLDLQASPAAELRARERIRDLPPAIENDGGDHQTYFAACICKGMGLTAEDAITILLTEFNPRCEPPWSASGLWQKVKNAYDYSQNAAGADTPEAHFAEVPLEEAENAPELSEAEQEQQEATVTGRPAGTPQYQKDRPVDSALRFIENVGAERLRFAGEQGYYYNGAEGRWVYLDDFGLQTLVLKDVEVDRPKLFRQFSPSKLRNVAAMVKHQMQWEGFDATPDTWLDGNANRNFVAVKNGIVDIEGMELLVHTPKWFSFTTLPFAYDPTATAPEFQAFLQSIWGDDLDVIDALQLWFGYVLLGDASRQKFAVFIGESRGGKGTLTRVLRKLVGPDNYTSCSVQSIAGEFGLAPLLGKRLAVFEDAQKSTMQATDAAAGKIITITGQDVQPVNRKNKEQLSVPLPVKIIVVCNEFPKFLNDKNALSNRMLTFPFERSFSGKEDTLLDQKLEAELPGIFNWALEGARHILTGVRLYEPRRGRGVKEDLECAMDNVRGFKKDCIEVLPPGSLGRNGEMTPYLTVEDIYRAYKEWCADSGHLACARNTLSRKFRSGLPEHVTAGVHKVNGVSTRVYTNVSLNHRIEGEFATPIIDDPDL